MRLVDDDASPGMAAYGGAALATMAALAAGLALQPQVGLENVDLVFIVAVVAVAARYGPGPAIVTSAGSALAYNFFFLPPVYTFAIANPTHAAALALFLVVALLTAHLAAVMRRRAAQARRRAQTTAALNAFSTRLAQQLTVADIARAAAETTGAVLDGSASALVADDDGAIGLGRPSAPHRAFEPFEIDAVRDAWTAAAGSGRTLLRLGDTLFTPILADGKRIGALGVARGPDAGSLAPDDERLLLALADQTGTALERVRLARERDAALLAAEAERLRSALLNALSHDLKTPLASILGAVTALREYGSLHDAAQREELTATIQDETERMHRFVVNLLDMARLEAGALRPRREPTDIADVAGAALRKLSALLRDHVVETAIGSDLPLLDIDPVLLQQALANLLENAAKFSPANTIIRVEAQAAPDGSVAIAVRDQGPGVPPEDRARVFDLFHQVRNEDRRPAGAGVGLAIAKSFVEALGGAIHVASEPGCGAAFVINFPAALATAAPELTA